jgi:hypothetical protein
MFTDVEFVGVDANTTNQQLIAYLKPQTKRNVVLLKQIPKINTSRTKIVTARASDIFCHVVPLDDTTIISLQDINIAKIFSVENTQLNLLYEIDLQEPNYYVWEALVIDKKAYILQGVFVTIVDTLTGSVLKKIRLVQAANQRYSHPCMVKTDNYFIIASINKICVYDLEGEFKYSLHERLSSAKSVEMISENYLAVGAGGALFVYNLTTREHEWSLTLDANIISLASFPELDILVVGAESRHAVIDLKSRKEVGKQEKRTWTTVKRVGYSWVALISEKRNVVIYDVLTHKEVHVYNEKANYTVVPWSRNRMIMLTDSEICIWE